MKLSDNGEAKDGESFPAEKKRKKRKKKIEMEKRKESEKTFGMKELPNH